jgi:hypothetical protein
METYGAFHLSFKVLFCISERCYFWLKSGHSIIESKLNTLISHSRYLSLMGYYHEMSFFNFEFGYADILLFDNEKVYTRVYFHGHMSYHLYDINGL